MKAVAMGVHVLDVLVRPVETIPEGQGGQLVEQIKLTAAGSAGGAALVLAKLGAEVRSAGAIGTDAAGDMLLGLLKRDAWRLVAVAGVGAAWLTGIAWRAYVALRSEILDGLHQPHTEHTLPEAIHGYARGQRVGRLHNPFRQSEAVVGGARR